MNYVIGFATVGCAVWFVRNFMQRVKGYGLTDQMSVERQNVTWEAARRVALVCGSFEIARAYKEIEQAKQRLAEISTKALSEYQHAVLDYKIAEENLIQAIVRSPAARETEAAVSRMYSTVIQECLVHPRRALRLYPLMKGNVDNIVSQMIAKHRKNRVQMRLISGGKDGPLTLSERMRIRSAKSDGSKIRSIRRVK